MSSPVFGTLLVPSRARALVGELRAIRGWRIASFALSGAGFHVESLEWEGYVDFAKAAFPYLDSAAILFTQESSLDADVFMEASGLRIFKRRVGASLNVDDHLWLDDLAVGNFLAMQKELVEGQAEVAGMRAKLEEIRTDFSRLETYLHRHDTPPLRKVWHAPYLEGTSLDLSTSFATSLPCSSFGVTRLQLWIAHADPRSPLALELKASDTRNVIAAWVLDAAQLDHRSGWVSFDLERSISLYGQPLWLVIFGEGWRVGASAPWISFVGAKDEVSASDGLALRVYATLPGIRGPRGVSLPTDDRRRIHLLGNEMASARALAVPAGIDFSPVSGTDQGLLVHPVKDAAMVAVIAGACPALTVIARLSVLHGHNEGESFLVTVTPGLEPASEDSVPMPPRASEAGVISEIGPLPVGSWVRVDSGAIADITFAMRSSPRSRDLHVATRGLAGRSPDLAWAIITRIEFVLADS